MRLFKVRFGKKQDKTTKISLDNVSEVRATLKYDL